MIHKTIQGVDVPALGLGTYLIKGAACRQGVAEALEMGYRHIDTAQAYGNEVDVGEGIQAAAVDRVDIFLTTKVWMDDLSPSRIGASVEDSLRRLATDYADLLLIHWPTETMDLEAILDVLVELRNRDRIRHFGVSNFPPTLFARAVRHAPVFCNQVEYHPFLDQSELRRAARDADVLLTAYSPIARGRVANEETIREIASRHDKTPVQIALRWLIQQDHVAAIPKASSSTHRRQNLDLFDFLLSEDDMGRIGALARGERLVDPAWAPQW